jgi:hypothetical protein
MHEIHLTTDIPLLHYLYTFLSRKTSKDVNMILGLPRGWFFIPPPITKPVIGKTAASAQLTPLALLQGALSRV